MVSNGTSSKEGGLARSFTSGDAPPLLSFPRSSLTKSTNSASVDSQAKEVEPTPPIATKSIDVDILSQSLALADNIFGLYALEVWHYNEASGQLINVPLKSQDEEAGQSGGGLYVKRMTQEADSENEYSNSKAMDAYGKLTDRSRKDYLGATPTGPGVGLPGVLWSEASSKVPNGGLSFGLHSMRGHSSERHISGGNPISFGGGSNASHEFVNWREVDVLANDPDQPYDNRLQNFAKAGFKLATGIPFDCNGYRGLVLFLANPHAEAKKLRDPANSRFIKHVAHLIGCSVAIQAPLEQAQEFKAKLQADNWHRLKIKLLFIVRLGGSLRQKNREQDASNSNDCPDAKKRSSIKRLREASARLRNDFKETLVEAKEEAKAKGARWLKKIQGGNAVISPSFTFTQMMWSFLGVAVTHCILSRIDLLITTESEGELALVLAPLGALTTLQYNLTAAPASQPRNAIFAQIFAITTTLLLGYIPGISPWFRSALAPAIVIPGMAKLGITHPPAGAAAVVFSSGKLGWVHFGIFLSGVCISITTAVIINNMSDKRQYPISWPLVRKAKSFCAN
eukprot:g1004.t1 g1004   contig10:1164842-1166801(+)